MQKFLGQLITDFPSLPCKKQVWRSLTVALSGLKAALHRAEPRGCGTARTHQQGVQGVDQREGEAVRGEKRGEARRRGPGGPAAGRPGPTAGGSDAPSRRRPLPAPGVLPVACQRPQLVVGEGALQVVLVGVVEHGAHPLPEAQA